MTTRSTLPATEELSDEDIAVLMPVLAQIQQVRSDQREALIWLAQHTDEASQ